MRRTPLPPSPAVLDGSESLGARERSDAIAFYADAANHDAIFLFDVYRHDDVKQALRDAFHGKCAYCESPYDATQPVDVEHYRPKARVKTVNGPRRPGYYWLAATWENLLPSCIDCNRERHQRDHAGKVRLSGKGEWFPLIDESARAHRPGEECDEQPLLLHPYFDIPDDHLEFIEEGAVRSTVDQGGRESEKGTETIRVLGLDRRGLVERRRAHLVLVDTQLKRVRRAETRVARNQGDRETMADYETEVAELSRLIAPGTPYTAMALQAIRRQRPT